MYDSKLLQTTRCFIFVRITEDDSTRYEISLRPGAKLEYKDRISEIGLMFDNCQRNDDSTLWRFANFDEAEQKLQWAVLKWD